MNQVRVLVVEDDKTSSFTIRKLLVDEGFEICAEVSSGEEALASAKEMSPDVILMDISIEGDLDGVETAAELNKFCDAPIIYMSGYGDDETIDRAKKTNPNAYLLKPFTKRELKISIDMALYKHKTEQKLRENELRLSTVLANVPSAIIYTDADYRIRYINPTAEHFLNVMDDAVDGCLLDEVLKLKTLRKVAADNLPMRLFGDDFTPPSHDPLLLETANGGQFILEPWGSMVPTPEGGVDGYLLVLRNVTQQHEAEERVRTMAAALASFEEAVVVTGYNDKTAKAEIVYANRGFERVMEWTREEVLGETLSIIGCCSCDNAFYAMMENSLRKDMPFHGESINQTKSGKEIVTQWSASPVKDRDGHTAHVAYVIRDVTQLRRLEENIRQSQKIEAVGRLAGGIAHDFNNLLSVINSYSDLLTLKLEEDSVAMKYARQIRSAGKRGADLVSQLMTFSRRDKPNPSALDLSTVCDEIKGMLQRVIRENIELTTHYEANLFQARADQGQVEQALINLCVNARDAMPNGGHIRICLKNKTLTQKDAEQVNLINSGNYVVIAVEDDGCGIDSETQKHIFDPFFTTKEIGKGTGLGLSTVYGIMKHLGGTVTVDSKVGEGATFSLWFPATDQEPCVTDGEKSGESIPEGTEMILVVEDDDTFLDCISGLLRLHGYHVLTATNGVDALEQLDQQKKPLSLLITDIVLPKMSGREVASRVLKKSPETKIIFMTGYDDQLDTFYDFPGDSLMLEKPFPLNKLLVQVRDLIDETGNDDFED
ncbi:MAG: response regulator [Opitutales bacterium]|nr:response regulator [Opitutales bacterium]